MTFTGDQFWAFSDETLKSEWPKKCAQGAIRSVVSRAYYAAFLRARDFAEARGAEFGEAKTSHQQVIDWFYSRLEPALNDIADKLDALRKQRNSADYATTSGWRASDASVELENAKRVLDALKSLSPTTL